MRSTSIPETLRAVLYTRVSTTGQAENGTSLAAQFAACLQKAEQIGAAVIEHYEDAGVSGAKYEEREGMQKAIAAIEEGRANVLICYDLSRYSRDSEHQVLIKRRIETAGGRLVFCTLTFDNNADGDLLFDLTRAFPVWERRKIRERMEGGKKRKAEEGIQPFRSRRPFGYHLVTKTQILRGEYSPQDEGRYFIVEEEAVTVRHMFEHYAGGKSLRQLCQWLNDSKIPTTAGGDKWRPQVVRRMLQNPLYKGAPAVYKTKRHDTAYERTNPDTWTYLAAPAIVDAGTWQGAQDRMSENKASKSGNPERRYPLTGMIVCPTCGRRMKAVTSGSKPRYTRYYRCPYSQAHDYSVRFCGMERCTYETRLNAERIEAQVDRAVEEAATNPDKLTAAYTAYHARQGQEGFSEAEYQRINRELDKLREREQRTVKAQIAGISSGADPSLYAEEFADIAARRTYLQNCKRSQEERRRAASPLKPGEAAHAIAQKISRIGELLAPGAIPYHKKNELLSRVVKDVQAGEEGSCLVRMQPTLAPQDGVTVTYILMKVCDTHNIPLATNIATAEMLVDNLVKSGRPPQP